MIQCSTDSYQPRNFFFSFGVSNVKSLLKNSREKVIDCGSESVSKWFWDARIGIMPKFV